MRELLYLLKIFMPYKWILFAGVLLSSLASFANIALMGASGWFITAMGLAGIAGATINYFTPASIIRACAILRTVGRYAERILMHEAAFRLIANLRRSFYDAYMPLVPAVSGLLRSGEALSRLRGDIDLLERFYLRFLVPFLSAIIIGTLILLYFNKYAVAQYYAVAFFLCVIFIPVAVFLYARKREKFAVEQMADLKIELTSILQGMNELAVYDNDGVYERKFMQLSRDIEVTQLGLNRSIVIANNAVAMIINICMLSVFYAVHSRVAAADAVMLTFIVLASAEVLMPIPEAFQNLSGVLHATKRILDIITQENKVIEPSQSLSINDFNIKFDNVTFSYDGRKNILSNLSFDLKQGDRLLIKGPSGIGKSSIVSLILKFWSPNAGRITIDGIDINSIDGNLLRSRIAVLEQKPYIFADTIKNNLLFSNHEADEKLLDEACKNAGIYEFIKSLPDGYDTFVGEKGRELSGGQVKRLALARALLKPDVKCLILDEPGEGIDYSTESEIINKVIQDLDGISLIIISHRSINLPESIKTLIV